MTTPPNTRRRGRPKGSGEVFKADKPRLAQMADYMLSNPDADVVDAVHAVLPAANESDEHRLRRKFREGRDALMAAAKNRAEAKAAPRSAGGSTARGIGPGFFDRTSATSSIARAVDQALCAEQALDASGLKRLMEEETRRDMLYGGPTMRRLLEQEEKVRKMTDRLYGGPTMRRFLEEEEKFQKALNPFGRSFWH